MKLVDDWKDAWKWISTNCMVLAATVQGAWISIPDDLKQSVPVWIGSAVTIGLLALGVAGRLLKQGSPDANSDIPK